MCHTWYFGDHPEDHYQVDSERGDMGELNMIMENHYYLLHLFHVCWHFDKGATSNIDYLLQDHVEVPHVPPLAVHLVMVLRMVSEVPSVAHKSKSHH